MVKEFCSVKEIADLAKESNKKMSEIILENQAQALKTTPDEVFDRMRENYRVMRHSIEGGLADTRSASGLTGGLSNKLMEHDFKLIAGTARKASVYATAAAEHNACMGRIVAAPTAGSCGILPGVLAAVGEEYNIPEADIIMGLITASGIGMIISKNATVSGAEGGCQAECGSAAAMAAAAVCEIMGGTPDMCLSAIAFAFEAVMGLVCDPVAGLVETPCVKRNTSGALNAVLAAEIALAGEQSVIPADEVIDAMYRVGNMMNHALRETALGGLAGTPTAKKIEQELRAD